MLDRRVKLFIENNFSIAHKDFFEKTALFFLTIVLGGLGGVVFYIFNLPLPWSIGPMLTVTFFAIVGVKTFIPRGLRFYSRILLALTIGSRLEADFLSHIYAASVSIGGMYICLFISSAVAYSYLRKVGGYSQPTAFYSAAPGQREQMMMLGSELGADERVVALIQTFRVIVIVSVTPIIVYILSDASESRVSLRPIESYEGNLFDIFIMILSAITGYHIAKYFKLSAANFVGPMLMFGFASAAGISNASPPDDLFALSQIMVASAYGSRFRGTDLTFVWRCFKHSVVSTSIHINFILIFSLMLNYYFGTDISSVYLAYTPGGQVEVGLLALYYGIDITFTSAHTLLRSISLVIVAPVFYRLFINRDETSS